MFFLSFEKLLLFAAILLLELLETRVSLLGIIVSAEHDPRLSMHEVVCRLVPVIHR